jgi:asparagine synthase (glutamine-hydrolysing)
MCGIAGLIETAGTAVDPGSLAAMMEILRHRGPDAGGLFIEGNVGLAHRRLSIIDTSEEANQPLFNEDRSVAVVFNGEIYNFQEIAEGLRQVGHEFRSRSDTEVIVHAWEEYGPDCLDHFRGMFAFALYDAGKGTVFLARDRLGKKPLYYVSTPSRFAFASEIKALRLLSDVSSDLDIQALGEYAAYGNTLGERSIYRDIRRLSPAHRLTLDLRKSDLTPRIDRYWQVKIDPDESLTEDEWVHLLDQELSEAVRLRLISDVPLGAFLSGGIRGESRRVEVRARRCQTLRDAAQRAGSDARGGGNPRSAGRDL